MSMHRWMAGPLLALPLLALAQNAAPLPMAMDHAAMPAMDHQATSDPAAVAPIEVGIRGSDYSDGIGHSGMPGMDMRDGEPLGMLRVDQLEAAGGRHTDAQAWDVQGWYGNDSDKLWLRSEGERSGGRIEDARLELLWDHTLTAFWDTQLGLRQDMGIGHRHWAAFGIQGLAPYWLELEATAYAGSSGRTAARLRVEYDLRFTQRWTLQPELEVNLYGHDDPASRIGSGLSDTQLGLRLRYEIRRELAPYIGVVWKRRYGAAAAYARQDGQSSMDRQFVAGMRFWF
ncbi:copper resistance protein B [Rhodanobacter sp. Col0626]|uniref:copper resistance protein B n=1 Tax=Rhodanobacter sp. Col0626 TaxID=3415679 RepID=UPI003CED14E1